jgi:hypothetical protein
LLKAALHRWRSLVGNLVLEPRQHCEHFSNSIPKEE